MGECKPARGTTLRWKCEEGEKRVSTSLTHVLAQLGSMECPAAVRVRVGACTHAHWNSVTVRRVYGATRVRVRRANGRVHTARLKDLASTVFTTQAAWAEQIVSLRVLKVTRSTRMLEGVRGELLQKLATTQHGGLAELKAMRFVDLEMMWARVPTLATAGQRERARGRLSKWSKQTLGVSLLARPTVRMPMSNVFPRAALQRAVRALYDTLDSALRPEIARLQRRTRFVSADPTVVGRLMTNWQKWSKTAYTPGVAPVCS